MLCELGLNVTNIQTTQDGIYYGMNSAISPVLRSQETNDEEFYDMKTTSGARNHRLYELLYVTYYGKIDTEIAKRVLSDHENVLTKKDHPSSKTVCVHSYADPERVMPFYPHGCTDGKVLDSAMAKNMQFEGIFGPCCGNGFDAKRFLAAHSRYHMWSPFLEDFPSSNQWTRMSFE
jgi:hypothetical protein